MCEVMESYHSPVSYGAGRFIGQLIQFSLLTQTHANYNPLSER